jgi:hypothetical protein
MSAREPGESFEAYRLRLSLEQRATKEQLRGRLFFDSRPRGLHRPGESHKK